MKQLVSGDDLAVTPAVILGEQVVRQLRILIITGQLRSGAHLVEAQLSDTFRVSRGPIRDALTQLEAEGLVERQRRGVFVRGLTSEDIDELYSLRESLEMLAIRLGVERAVEDAWAASVEPLARMREAAAEGDHAEFAMADLAFHTTFYDVAGHRRLRQMWGQYEPTFGVLLTLTTAEDSDLGPSYDSHVEILGHLRQGAVEAASTSLRAHLLGSRNRLVSAYARRSMSD